MSDSAYLFVYGTLRPPVEGSEEMLSFNYPKIVPFLRGETEAVLENADLYDLGSFPAAIRGTRRVKGVLFEIDPLAFTVLDPLEGHPEVYHREEVQVQTADGEKKAWVYWAPVDLALTGVLMESGDWLAKSPESGP